MGEVYKARDTRLNRFVAIKTSHKKFGERFQREARAVAALNHSNICQLYDVGPDYLVMEFVDGAPIKGPLPLADALRFARQIADALDHAHRKSLTHRDLKPANIMVTHPAGAQPMVKLLDFGLAKFQKKAVEKESGNAGEAETLTAALTEKDIILGTLQYMPPEQLEGEESDERSDIFSFGCVLYEIVAGKRAFEGKSGASMIAAIMSAKPAPIEPPALNRLVETCLAKDPEERFQTARDLKRALQWLTDADDAGHPREQPSSASAASQSAALPQQPVPPQPARGRRFWIWLAIAALCLLATAGTAGYFITRPTPAAITTRFTVEAPPGTMFTGIFASSALSPDGRYLVFGAAPGSGQSALWLRPLDSLAARPLPGTEGGNLPFWSPDSKSIAFFADGKLKRIELAGGGTVNLCDADVAGFGAAVSGTWNRDGVILFGGSAGLSRVAASGGPPVPVTKADANKEAGHGYFLGELGGGPVGLRVSGAGKTGSGR